MLTEADLNRMRMTARAALPDEALIQRRTLVPDGYGNETETWNNVQWIECRISPAQKPTEAAQGDVTTAQAEFVATLPWDTVIAATDRLQVKGTQYEIVEPVTDTSWRLSRRFRVRKV